MTTKDAIKLLPIEDKLKMQVLNMYDYMEPAEKLTIERLAWKSYFLSHDMKVQENTIREFADIEEGKAALGKEFFEDILKKTDHDDTKTMADTNTNVDLAAARRAMEQIINEIRASKKAPKVKN